MKQTSKRLQALVLVLAMCVSFLQIPSFALEGTHSYKIDPESVKIASDGKYTATQVCTLEGHTDSQTLNGTATVKATTEATCKKGATITYTVTLEGREYSAEYTTSKALPHKTEKKTVVDTEATCTEGGIYHVDDVCTVCGTTVTIGKREASKPNGHKFNDKGICTVCGAKKPETPEACKHVASKAVKENVVEPTCTKAGSYDLVEYCALCGDKISSDHVVVPAQHTKGEVKRENVVDSTCVKEGSYTEVTYCAICKAAMSRETKTIAKKEHIKPATPVEENDTATCQKAGTKDEVYYCAVCKTELERKSNVPSAQKPHHYADPVKENVVEATCTKAGSYDSVVYCTAGKEEYSRKNVIIPAKGHDYKNAVRVLVWDDDSYLVDDEKPECDIYEKCNNCDETHYVGTVAVQNVKEDTSKFVAQEFPCKPGSKTFVATYEYTTADQKKVTLTETKAYNYYKDYKHYHNEGTAQIENVVEPTCSKNGSYDVVVRCTVCNDILASTPLVIGKTGNHTAAAAKKENVVAATTKKGGSYDLVVRCADCGKVLSKTHKTTAKIVVNASKVTKATNVKGKKAKITVKKAASVTGYQIQYGTKKNFKGAKAVKTKATTKTLTKLTKNKKYYVRVRTYKVVSGKTYYSSWSGSKTVTIKK